LLRALAGLLPDFEPTGIAAGLHLVAWLPPDVVEERVVEEAARHGLTIAGVSPYRIAPGRGGLVFGYSDVNERDIRWGVRLLADAVESLRGNDGLRGRDSDHPAVP
jgi:GntR family transcriptional regulator/MocR family aminotransferase